ncbi:MAG: LysR substrate-binding domain-containing protein [Beijerinckiaceae bacterium]
MNLRDLEYIVAIDEHGHFGRAAEACHVSQPTLSGQVAKLEAQLGVSIFQRDGRQVRATEAGREIVAHARRALSAAADISAAARAHRDPLSGKLKIGVIPTLGPYLMPYVLPHASEKLPDAPLVLIEDLTANLVPLVAEGKLDGALIATNPEIASLQSIELFDEPFSVATPPNHPLAAKKSLRKEDLDPASLLLLTDGHCLRDQALDLCQHPLAGENAMADMRATSMETLLHLTAAGYGVTLVPQLAVECGRATAGQLVIRPLTGVGASRRVRLIYRRNSPRSRALIELARIIRASLPEGVRRLGKQAA